MLKSSQEARVSIHTKDEWLSGSGEDWPFLLQMSEVLIKKNGSGTAVDIEATKNKKCVRCWRHRADIGASPSHPDLCPRCVDVVDNKKYVL